LTQPAKNQGLRRTAGDIGLTFARQFLAGLMQLGILLIVARELGPEGAGGFAIALLLPTLMSQLLNLGLTPANVYFIASKQFSLELAWAATRDIMLAVTLAGVTIGTLLIIWLGEWAFPGIDVRILLAALMIFPFSLLLSVIVGLFQAMQDFRTFNIAVLAQPVLAVLGILLVWIFGQVTLLNTITIVVLANVVALCISLRLLSRRVSLRVRPAARFAYLRPALSYGVKAHLSNILAFLNYRLDVFLVNLIVGTAAAGIYTVAVRLVEQLWMVSKATSTVIFPRLSAMHGDEAAKREFTPIIARSVLWVTLLGAGVLAILAVPLITLLFGKEFIGASAVLFLLLPGVVLFSCARVLANDMASRGHVGMNLALAGLVLIVNVFANLWLIPKYGVMGAAGATTIAYTTIFVICLVLQRYITGTQWWQFVLPMREDVQLLRNALKKRKKT
jgi:O-antigen/teichoic acid export membrane protein